MEKAEHNPTDTHINHLESEPLFPLPHRTPAINHFYCFMLEAVFFFFLLLEKLFFLFFSEHSLLAAYIANLSEFYSYRLIGKLTAFLQLQELCLRNQIVDFSTTVAWLFLLWSNLGLEISLSRLQIYVLTSTLMDRQSRLSLTLTLHTRKLLVF